MSDSAVDLGELFGEVVQVAVADLLASEAKREAVSKAQRALMSGVLASARAGRADAPGRTELLEKITDRVSPLWLSPSFVAPLIVAYAEKAFEDMFGDRERCVGRFRRDGRAVFEWSLDGVSGVVRDDDAMFAFAQVTAAATVSVLTNPGVRSYALARLAGRLRA